MNYNYCQEDQPNLKKKMTFSAAQKIWLIEEGAKIGSPMAIKRAFVIRFKLKPREAGKLKNNQLTRVIETFRRTESVSPPKRKGSRKSVMVEENIVRVKNHFSNNPRASIRSAANVLQLSCSSLRNILKHELKMQPYKLHRSQELSNDHKQQRVKFCHWVTEEEIDPQMIIFTDEKWFYMNSAPNRQNSRYWSTKNPYVYEECYNQGKAKIMCWTGIVDGKVLPIFWFENEDGSPASVNRERYLSVLKEILWPAVRAQATRKGYYYMQDGAPPHCTNDALDFLADKFPGRVISRRSENVWPAHSPDLNPLDFWFWGYIESRVFEKKPDSVLVLKKVVEDAAREINPEMVKNVAANFGKRVIKCIEKRGGPFEAEL
jgi:inhibitor of nuclear factor kappa-B kinase subunit alpha